MAPGPRLQLASGTQRTFLHLLLNTVTVSVVNFTVWFALTFWVYLETHSVFATGMIAGVFLVATASTGIWFGSLVDNHPKRRVMLGAGLASLVVYAGCLALYLAVPDAAFTDVSSPWLWLFVVLSMVGVIAGNPRTIALPTLVTLLIPADRRDRANGLVGTATGVSFLVTSVISGLLVAAGGMLYVLLLGIVVVGLASLHLLTVPVPEGPAAGGGTPAEPIAAPDPGPAPGPGPRHAPGPVPGPAAVADPATTAGRGGVDLRGTLRLVGRVPGLPALILFSCFNNFLGGAFLALMDAYGLSLVSVQVWGLLWGALSTLIIVGGLVVARIGLGRNPVRTLLLVNLVLWTVTVLFPLRSSIVLLTAGMAVYMALMPFAEAAEQTVLQKVVPYERQGRVFGFAQSVEQAASPVTAFLIGPITQFVFIPWMTDGWGARTFGSWFGTGAQRGIAVVFVLTGVLGVALTFVALGSRYYRQLSGVFHLAPAAEVGSGQVGSGQVGSDPGPSDSGVRMRR